MIQCYSKAFKWSDKEFILVCHLCMQRAFIDVNKCNILLKTLLFMLCSDILIDEVIYMTTYNEFKDITDLKECVFFCHITNSYNNGNNQEIDLEDKDVQNSIYHCAQGAWIISKDMLPHIKYVFAVYHNQVVGIYKVSADLWTQRTDLYKKYDYNNPNSDKSDFPTEPNIREAEFHYSIALKDCQSINDIEKCLNKYKCGIDLSINDFKSRILPNKNFNQWQNKYFFTKDDTYNISDDVKDFLGKTLLFPIEEEKNHVSKYRTIHQNERYNFIIDKDSKIEYKKIYN